MEGVTLEAVVVMFDVLCGLCLLLLALNSFIISHSAQHNRNSFVFLMFSILDLLSCTFFGSSFDSFSQVIDYIHRI